jgi:hypothetical protein
MAESSQDQQQQPQQDSTESNDTTNRQPAAKRTLEEFQTMVDAAMERAKNDPSKYNAMHRWKEFFLTK